MCGVIGLIYERPRPDLGQVAAMLLRTLEYRGYDSTGAAIQPAEGRVVLRKGTGAPSTVCEPLGITALGGQIFCGQVRWATFGAVDDINAQPHVVDCHHHLYGAHNGNVTNSDDLQRWLRVEGHDVKSDNDGEMVVHTIEHFFARRLVAEPEAVAGVPLARARLMRAAIVEAGCRLQGSFAAIIVDPLSRRLWAIKAGSSLYAGVGDDERGGRFIIASSDLSSVLELTHRVLPLSRGEFLEYTADGHAVFGLADGKERSRQPVRNRFLTRDISLQPPFTSFMEQEIAAQSRTCREVITLFLGGSARVRALAPVLSTVPPADRFAIEEGLGRLLRQSSDDELRARFAKLVAQPAFERLESRAAGSIVAGPPSSSEAAVLSDLRGVVALDALALVDAWIEHEAVTSFNDGVEAFADRCLKAQSRGGRIYVVCCGSSFNAAKAAALFFSEIARVQLLPVIPGEFRGQYLNSLQDGDLFIAVSQSGETKDLIDVMTAVIASGKRIERMSMVNNVNSTLACELSDVVVPLHCGPEIAVPATKSFMNQLAVFYGLATRLGERRLAGLSGDERAVASVALAERRAHFAGLPELVERALESTREGVSEAAELLYLMPSMHILATRISAVAKEGALKVREVVLNHTEGFEGSEFKHGPNTILGFNTLFGPRDIERLLACLDATGVSPDAALDPAAKLSAGERARLFTALHQDYPLIYITGPEDADVKLTVSQVNTHKIRGSLTVVIAEPNDELRQAAEKRPAGAETYRSVYIDLPVTGDHVQVVFSATVALQRLALEMSTRKAAYLRALGVKHHGVHPDVPKNVSKSITVD